MGYCRYRKSLNRFGSLGVKKNEAAAEDNARSREGFYLFSFNNNFFIKLC